MMELDTFNRYMDWRAMRSRERHTLMWALICSVPFWALAWYWA